MLNTCNFAMIDMLVSRGSIVVATHYCTIYYFLLNH